ncbi:MAG TPA: Hsp20/alpha crystallin family protein [Chitinophagaceae bacterium]|nr:Hsp20/alpha crystallin family protein [Chitinophagaceae bacterium]
MTNKIQRRNAPNAELGNVVDNIFSNTLRRFFDDNLWDIEGSITNGTVPVNVRETDQQYEVDVIAPGCKKEHFKIQVQNNELQVSFNQDESKKQEDEKAGWVRNEFMQRSFARHFTLDETVDASKISAEYADGILRVVLPKNEKAKPRLLTINVK